jgi:hypothetical protein
MATPTTQQTPWAGVPWNPDVTTPQVFASPETDQAPALQPIGQMGGAPQVFASAPPMPNVTEEPSPVQRQIAETDTRLRKLQSEDANPYGSPNNHPGIGGKILHALSVASNIAGDIFAPATMAEIPQTDLGRRAEEGGLSRRLLSLQQGESEDEARGASTALTKEETADLPGKNADTHALNESGIAEHNAQAANLLHPQAKTDFEAWQQQNPGKPIEEWLKVQAANKTVRPDTPEQQYLDEYQRTHPGSSVADAERAYTLDTQRPPQIAPIMMMVPNSNGGSTATVVRPGTEIAPGAQTAAGLNSSNTPTAQMRNTAQRAELVHAMTPEVLANIDANAATLGPVMGHWNDFMQGRIGADNPAFAQLRSDLLLYSSSVALAHAQGRLPENLREEFDRMINAPNQTPANLKAVIQEIDKAMQLNTQVMTGKPGNPGSSGAAPKEGDTKLNGAGIKVKFSGGKWAAD